MLVKKTNKAPLLFNEIEIKLLKSPNEYDIIAFISGVYGKLKLNNIALRRSENGDLRISFPSVKKDNKQFWHYHPIDSETSELILSSIKNKLREIQEVNNGEYEHTNK